MPIEKPLFNGSYTRQTGSGESFTVVFAAHDQNELRKRLHVAAEVAHERLHVSNAEVQDVGEIVRDRFERYRAALEREILEKYGLSPADPTTAEGGSNGDAAARPSHLRADP